MQKINTDSLDIAGRDSDFVLCCDGTPVTTPAGNEVSYHDAGLLEHILRDLCITGALDSESVNAYSVFAVEHDFIPDGRARMVSSVKQYLASDPVIPENCRKSAKQSDQDESSEKQAGGFDVPKNICFPLYFNGFSCTVKHVREFMMEQTQGEISLAECSLAGFSEAVGRIFESISPACLAVAAVLSKAHGSGVILPLLLILKRITPSEYANALLSLVVCGAPKSQNTSAFDILPQIRKLEFDRTDPAGGFRVIREQVSGMMDYISKADGQGDQHMGIGELIRAGESFSLEFKSSLRWNHKAEKKDPAIEHASLKTLAAFLNSAGGTLLIGVRDDGSIAGIEADLFPDTDRFSLHFWNLVRSYLGQDTGPFIGTQFETIEGKTVLAAHVRSSPRPVFLKNKNEEEFYIRMGPGSVKLGIREALNYIESRFATH